MELTAVNLSRSRKLWPRTANLRRESSDWAQLRNFRSHMSSSVEIDLAGISIHLPNFSDICPRPLLVHTYSCTCRSTCRTKHSHANPKILGAWPRVGMSRSSSYCLTRYEVRVFNTAQCAERWRWDGGTAGAQGQAAAGAGRGEG
jgi:hypothetical protein